MLHHPQYWFPFSLGCIILCAHTASAQCFNDGCTGEWSGGSTTYVLSGGPDPGTPISSDDQLNVCVNGQRVYCDSQVYAGDNGVVSFTANPGDTVRITSYDYFGSCRSRSAVWVHSGDGCSKKLADARSDGCAGYPAGFLFDDFTSSLPDWSAYDGDSNGVPDCGQAALVASIQVNQTELGLNEELQVTLRLTNTGSDALQSITGPNLVQAGEAKFDVVSGPDPASIGELASGASDEMAYVFKATHPGDVVLTCIASAQQNGVTIESNIATSQVIRVQGFTVEKVEPVQVVYGVDLVADKPTLVRATLFSGFAERQQVIVNTLVKDPIGESINVSETIELEPGTNKLLLPRTGSFLMAGSGTIRVTVDPDNILGPEHESKHKEEAVTVHVVAPLRLHFVAMAVANVPVVDIFTAEVHHTDAPAMGMSELAPAADAAVEFLNAVYPLPPFSSAAQLFYPQPLELTHRQSFIIPGTTYLLNRMQQWCYFSGTEKLIGFTPFLPKIHTGKDVGKQTLWEALGDVGTTGEAKRNGKPGMVISYLVPGQTSTSAPGVVAHELGHTFGLPTINNGSPCVEGLTTCEEYAKFGEAGRPASEGVWVSGREAGLSDEQIQIPDTGRARNFMANQTAFRSGTTINTWVAQDDYQYLRAKLQAFFRDPQAIILSAVIARTGEVLADPWYTILTEDLSQPDPAGAYQIRMLDANGQTLSDFPFSVSFVRETEPALVNPDTEAGAVTLSVERPAGLVKVQILKDEQVLFERQVSALSPALTIQTPAGGETYQPGDTVNLQWTGSDGDGDALTYVVLFSDDGGVNWAPVAMDLTDATLAWLVPDVGTRAGVIRIMASDGLNTAIADSQRFTIHGSGAQGLVASAGAARQVTVGDLVSLDGRSSRDSAQLDAELGYQWSVAGLPGTVPVTLSDPNSPTPSFVPPGEGRYLFKLTVNKDNQQSLPAYVSITALNGENPGEDPQPTVPPNACGAGTCGAGVTSLMPLMIVWMTGRKRRSTRRGG